MISLGGAECASDGESFSRDGDRFRESPRVTQHGRGAGQVVGDEAHLVGTPVTLDVGQERRRGVVP